MKESDYNRILTDLEMIARDNKEIAIKVMKVKDTQFDLNVTDTKRIMSKLKTIRKKMAEIRRDL